MSDHHRCFALSRSRCRARLRRFGGFATFSYGRIHPSPVRRGICHSSFWLRGRRDVPFCGYSLRLRLDRSEQALFDYTHAFDLAFGGEAFVEPFIPEFIF